MGFGQTIVTAGGQSGEASLLISPGDGPTLLFNADPANIVWLGDDPFGTTAGDTTGAAPLPPLASLPLDGKGAVYGICATGQTALVSRFPGGLNFFQLVELLIKTLIIAGSLGNGLFVYAGAPGAGNFPILSVTTASTDPYGNAVNPNAINDTGLPLLIYNPAPPAAAGLKASVAPVTGTDVYGNNINSGLSAYRYHTPGGQQGFATLTGTSLLIQDWTGKLQVKYQFTGGDAIGDGCVVPALFANAGLVGGTYGAAEVWNPVQGGVGFVNGWANSGTGPGMQYRLNAAPANTVDLIGDMSAGTLTSPTTIFTLPAAYRPASVQSCLPVASGGGAGLVVGTSRFVFNANGTVQAVGMAGFTAAGRLFLRYCLSLDA
jgi:hypothetical protein